VSEEGSQDRVGWNFLIKAVNQLFERFCATNPLVERWNGLIIIRILVRLEKVLDPGTHSGVDTVWDVSQGLRTGSSIRRTRTVGGCESPDTLRHYERLGVLKEPPRTQAGYRLCPADALSRVLLIRNVFAVRVFVRRTHVQSAVT
jgi:hypothetical protein